MVVRNEKGLLQPHDGEVAATIGAGIGGRGGTPRLASQRKLVAGSQVDDGIDTRPAPLVSSATIEVVCTDGLGVGTVARRSVTYCIIFVQEKLYSYLIGCACTSYLR